MKSIELDTKSTCSAATVCPPCCHRVVLPTQYMMSFFPRVSSLLTFLVRIFSHTPNSGHLLLESNMAARCNSFTYTKSRVSRLQGPTNREIKVIILYPRNRRLWRSSTENLRIRTVIMSTSVVVGPPYLTPTNIS